MRQAALFLIVVIAGIPCSAGEPARIELTIERADLPATGLVLTDIKLSCVPLTATADALACNSGAASATLPGWGTLRGTLRLRYQSPQQWTAAISEIALTPGKLSLMLEQKPAGLELQATTGNVPVERLLSLAKILKLEAPLAGTGVISGTVSGRFSAAGWNLRYGLKGSGLTLNEPSGRYASEKLELRLDGTAQGRGDMVSASALLGLAAGQAYAEPIFADFGAHPGKAQVDLRWLQKAQRLELVRVAWDQPGVTRGSGSLIAQLGAAPAVRTAELTLDSATLPAFAQTYVQPFLAGTRAEGLTGSGALSGSLRIESGQVLRADLSLDGVALQAPRFDSELQGMHGAMHWAPADAPPSQLRWSAGRAQRVPLGAADLAFRVQGRDFALLKPWRQPILDGALTTQRLTLTHAGLADMGADFQAEIEPIDLAALCDALGWPKFSGKLSGRLPGLTLRDQVFALDGKLEAQVFDGQVTIEALQLIEPWGVLPRLAASLRLRNLDLGELTGAFSFGRIEGRLDGDVEDLRLLNWQPVAFKARLATPPDDHSRHRISQHAIDNISSIGGGPRGVLSRGILSVFKDFNYDRIGWGCVLANGVCTMDGVEPTPDGKGYVLVKGKGLPRIDVVGYSREVNWRQLVQQIESARNSQPASTRSP